MRATRGWGSRFRGSRSRVVGQQGGGISEACGVLGSRGGRQGKEGLLTSCWVEALAQARHASCLNHASEQPCALSR